MDKGQTLIQEAIAKGIKLGSTIDRRHFNLEILTYDIVTLTPHIDPTEDVFDYREQFDELYFSNRLVYINGIWCKVHTKEENFSSYDEYIPIFDAMED